MQVYIRIRLRAVRMTRAVACTYPIALDPPCIQLCDGNPDEIFEFTDENIGKIERHLERMRLNADKAYIRRNFANQSGGKDEV